MERKKSIRIERMLTYLFSFVLLLCLTSCGGGGGSDGISSDSIQPSNTTSSGFIDGGASDAVSREVVLSISATDNKGVAAYFASESSEKPSADSAKWTSISATNFFSDDVSFTLSEGYGNKAVYVWFKDAAGNISASVSDSIHLAIAAAPPESPEPVAFFNMGLPPVGWTSGQAWINAVDDAAKPGDSSVEIDWVRFYCIVGGFETIVSGEYTGNETGIIPDGGGLYLRNPWFGGDDYHEPLSYLSTGETVTYPLSSGSDRVWHPIGKRETVPVGATRCYASARVKPDGEALVQVGLDFWVNETVGYCGPELCNKEASGSNWYGESVDWIIISSD
ncbi:MAG: hypothetical protein AB1442_04395 [Nitrospirota bacterium]